MQLTNFHLFIIFLFALVLIKWTKESYKKTTALNLHGVHDLPESNPSVQLRPLQNEPENFNFFARDADILLRGRFVDVNKMTPTLENKSELVMKSEENRLRFEGN
jgi:hypothetical protein